MQRCGTMESSVGREKKLSKHSETCGKIWPIWRMLLRYQRDGRRICASIKQNTRILSAHLEVFRDFAAVISTDSLLIMWSLY